MPVACGLITRYSPILDILLPANNKSDGRNDNKQCAYHQASTIARWYGYLKSDGALKMQVIHY
jgi:hypothetical protein